MSRFSPLESGALAHVFPLLFYHVCSTARATHMSTNKILIVFCLLSQSLAYNVIGGPFSLFE